MGQDGLMGPYSCVRCFGPIRTALCSFTQTFMDGYISVGCCSESFYYVKLVDVSLAKAGHMSQTQIQCGWGLCGGLNDSVHFRATGVVPELAFPAIIERLFKTFWVFFFSPESFPFLSIVFTAHGKIYCLCCSHQELGLYIHLYSILFQDISRHNLEIESKGSPWNLQPNKVQDLIQVASWLRSELIHGTNISKINILLCKFQFGKDRNKNPHIMCWDGFREDVLTGSKNEMVATAL